MMLFTMNKWKKHPSLDDISLYVQDCGGYFIIQRHVYEFYIPEEYREFLIMKYPFLEEIAYVY